MMTLQPALAALEWMGVFTLGTLFGAWVVDSERKRRARADEQGPLL